MPKHCPANATEDLWHTREPFLDGWYALLEDLGLARTGLPLDADGAVDRAVCTPLPAAAAREQGRLCCAGALLALEADLRAAVARLRVSV